MFAFYESQQSQGLWGGSWSRNADLSSLLEPPRTRRGEESTGEGSEERGERMEERGERSKGRGERR